MKCKIRRIEKRDDAQIEKIIRSCLIEFGGDHEGTAWADPNLGKVSEIYTGEKNAYWVAENQNGTVVGGVGIGELPNVTDTCELQKMYCCPSVRGTGVAHLLIQQALTFATERYDYCYLETLESMKAAQNFYEKYGFKRVAEAIGETGHTACDVRYIKHLEK